MLYEIALTPGNKIIAAGTNGFDENYVKLYDSDGNADTAFHDFTSPGTGPAELIVNDSGNIFFVERMPYYSLNYNIWKLKSDGYTDTSFGINGCVIVDLAGTRDVATDINAYEDNIICTGYTEINGNDDFSAIKLDGSGELYPGFNTDGKLHINIGTSADYAHQLLLLPDGDMLIGGNTDAYDIAKIKSDGTPDSSFGYKSIDILKRYGNDHYTLSSLLRQEDGKLIATGYNGNINIVRTDAEGIIDTGFAEDGWLHVEISDEEEYYAFDAAIQGDGKIFFTGTYYNYDLFSDKAELFIGKLNNNGSYDSSFSDDGWMYLNTDLYEYTVGRCLALQADNKILVGGYYYDGEKDHLQLLRCNADGSPDESFGDSGIVRTDVFGNGGRIYGMQLQTDGKIVCVGYEGEYDTMQHILIARFNTDGMPDTDFSSDGFLDYISDMNSQLKSLAIDEDGNILVTGFTTGASENSDMFTARITPQGEFDTLFGLNGVIITSLSDHNDIAYDIAVQPDGKIVVAGTSSENLKPDFAVVRYIPGYIIPDAVDDISLKNNFIVFPNPVATEQFTLQYDLLADETISIELFDLKGARIKDFFTGVSRAAGEHSEILPVGDLAAGNYLLVISAGAFKTSVQLIVI